MARRRLSRSYKRRRRKKIFLILGLVIVTVLITMLLTHCREEHANLIQHMQLPDGPGDE